jgi:protein-L-isoaspartate(D-aspartate) O-methyltransferase
VTLAQRRADYAARLTAALRPPDPRLRAAFAVVPREAFLGPPPWRVFSVGELPRTTSDPSDLYEDVLVSLDATKGLNNGSPALHADMLHGLDVRPGARVLHVGCGGGYYSAILAELTGPGGVIDAVEVVAALAGAAAEHLRPWPWVRVRHGDGADYPAGEVDRIYINAAIICPLPRWLDALAMDGKLLAPLGAPNPDAPDPDAIDAHSTNRAALLTLTRTPSGYVARLDTPVAFICAQGPAAGDAQTRAALWQALGEGGTAQVTLLRRGPAPADVAWLSTPMFSLCRT